MRALAGIYSLDCYFKSPIIPTFRYVHEVLIKCRRVLDIGCSMGQYLQLLPIGSIGIDVDWGSLKECRRRGLQVVLADADKPFPLADASVDGVLASHVMEHMRSPIGFLEEVYRVLRPQGVLVLGLPIEGGIAGPWLRYYEGHRGLHGHLYSFSIQNLDELLRLSGFQRKRLFFHIAKIGYKQPLTRIQDLLQFVLPDMVLYKLSSAYWAVAIRR